MKAIQIGVAIGIALLAMSCNRRTSMPEARRDVHSYSNPEQVRVRHLELSCDVLFDRKILKGTAALQLERSSDGPLILDTRNLDIEKAEWMAEGSSFQTARFEMGPSDPVLGAPLTIHVPAEATVVRIHYSTQPSASALQWLEPAQTAGKQQPFLFTQSQAIHARSWIPLQDSPGVRMTYRAQIRTPKHLLAVMSAGNDTEAKRTGDYTFVMRQPIPSYLIALAVGDLDFRGMGQSTGVYAEKALIERAAKEFEDTEKMLRTAQDLYGPYRWGRYDLLVMPPSFPFGGMENPRLTFVTPTIIAGDKSLVSLVAHELAHSWSGNLVSNATWSDFWLNEGFTVYVERRIIEKIYGKARAEMEAALGFQSLEKELARLDDRDEILHVDLKGRDPDEGFTDVPYEKGALFLRALEESFGRERFDAFLRKYFDHFQFHSITTGIFTQYLKKHLFEPNPEIAAKIPLEEWLYKPGLPSSAPRPSSAVFAKVDETARRWLAGTAATALDTQSWGTHEWLHFLRALPPNIGISKMRELDSAFRLTRSGNAEILNEWLLLSIRNGYEPAYPKLEEFLVSVGRRKYLKPLYEELVKTPEGKKRAMEIYRKARPGYHPIAVATIDGIVK